MLGPGVAAYLVLSVILFATGALGVLIRRSPLIILLALEIMLNAGNLALIAFARQLGDGDGQIFALTVMVVAAAEAVVGLGLIVAVSRKRVDLDVVARLPKGFRRPRLDQAVGPRPHADALVAEVVRNLDERDSHLSPSAPSACPRRGRPACARRRR